MSRERKRTLLAGLLAHVESEIATMRKAAYDAAQAATHEEAKPENDKDTRAIEASYLAAGQAERVRALETAVKVLTQLELKDIGKTTPICASAVITLEDDDGARTMVQEHVGAVLSGARQGAARANPRRCDRATRQIGPAGDDDRRRLVRLANT